MGGRLFIKIDNNYIIQLPATVSADKIYLFSNKEFMYVRKRYNNEIFFHVDT